MLSDTLLSTERLKHDDALMLQITYDYMKLMGIENTQYIIARQSTVNIRIATSSLIGWTITTRRLVTRMTFAGMRKFAKC